MKPLTGFLHRIASTDEDLSIGLPTFTQVVTLDRIFDFDGWTMPSNVLVDIAAVRQGTVENKIYAIFNSLPQGQGHI